VTALPARGEVSWCEDPEVERRPVVVLSGTQRFRVCGAHRSDQARPRSEESRTRYGLEPTEDPIPRISVVNLDSVESVSIGTLVERLARLSDDRMRRICDALAIAVACEP
jgi:mRNA interferase MazF